MSKPRRRPAQVPVTPEPQLPVMPAPRLDQEPESEGSSVEHGYRVQIRDHSFSPHHPVALHDGIVGPDWRYLDFVKGNNPAGVPTPPYGYLDHHNLLTFKGATALAWTTLAQSHYRNLECRLVKFQLVVEHKVFRKGVCRVPQTIGGDSLSSIRGGTVDDSIKMEDES